MKRKYKNIKFVQSPHILAKFRRTKDSDELGLFKKSQRITRLILRRVPAALKPGITERQLAHKLLTWAITLGAEGLAFDPIVAFGTNTSRPHHHPTDRKLRRGDLVQVDVGARFCGYCADQSRVFFTGRPTLLQQKVYGALEQAKKAATLLAKAGASNHALDRSARAVLRQVKLEQYFTHTLGHGVGLEIHEGVSLSQRAPEQNLLSGEIITIEPGVYLPGKFGMRLEDEIVIR